MHNATKLLSAGLHHCAAPWRSQDVLGRDGAWAGSNPGGSGLIRRDSLTTGGGSSSGGSGGRVSRLETLMRSLGAASRLDASAAAGSQAHAVLRPDHKPGRGAAQLGAPARHLPPALAGAGTLFITFGNSAVAEFIDNWVLSVQQLGLPFVIGALDRKTGWRCAQAGLPRIDLWRDEVGGSLGGWAGGCSMHGQLLQPQEVHSGAADWRAPCQTVAPCKPAWPPCKAAPRCAPAAAGGRRGRDSARRRRLVFSHRVHAVPKHGSHQGAALRPRAAAGCPAGSLPLAPCLAAVHSGAPAVHGISPGPAAWECAPRASCPQLPAARTFLVAGPVGAVHPAVQQLHRNGCGQRCRWALALGACWRVPFRTAGSCRGGVPVHDLNHEGWS